MKHLKITLELDLKFPEASLTLSNGDIIHFDIEQVKKMDANYLRESILDRVMTQCKQSPRNSQTLDVYAKKPIATWDEWSIFPTNHTYIENGEECDPDYEETLIEYHCKLTTKIEEVK